MSQDDLCYVNVSGMLARALAGTTVSETVDVGAFLELYKSRAGGAASAPGFGGGSPADGGSGFFSSKLALPSSGKSAVETVVCARRGPGRGNDYAVYLVAQQGSPCVRVLSTRSPHEV